MSAASPKPTKAPKGEGKPEGTSKTNPKAVKTKSVKPAGLSEQEKAVETLKGGGRFIGYIIWMMAFIPAGMMAYNIRLYAINTYGRVIHEFDPWFNMRHNHIVVVHNNSHTHRGFGLGLSAATFFCVHPMNHHFKFMPC